LRDNPAVAYEIETTIRENSAALPVSMISGGGASETAEEPAAAFDE